MWGCLLGPEKLEAEWRTGAGLFCPARKLGPVGQAWPSPWPCGRPAATPACASTPCLWSSWWRKQKLGSLLEWRPRWRMGPRSRMVPAIASGLVAVPWVPLAVASGLVAVPWVPLAQVQPCWRGLASVALVASTWVWVSSVLLWPPVVDGDLQGHPHRLGPVRG